MAQKAMRCVRPTAVPTWKNRNDISDQYLEKNTQLWARSLLSRGNQTQLAKNPDASSRPEIMKANRQPPKSARRATIGMLMAEASPLMAIMPLTACALLAGEMTSDNTATALGGIVPPPKPVNTLSASRTSRFGAKADARTDTTSRSRPARATGRRSKESDKGPTETTEIAQAPKVAVANCPATAADMSRSVEISTKSGGTIITAFRVETNGKREDSA